ncbi:MAG: Ig-like domain-containing protein [Acidobacteriota bacterium]
MRQISRGLWWIGLAMFAIGSVSAGTIDLAWNPITDADKAGYKVYYGTASRTYSSNKDVGNVTTTTLTGLTACTRYYMAVKAYDTGGLESTNYSNEVVGLPRPVVTTVTPSSAEQGASVTLTIDGESFDTGATVAISGTGITILATRRNSCSQLAVDVKVDLAATTGARDVTVTNPDLSFGVKAAGFTVAANVAPTVSSTDPVAGATNVAITKTPTVTFSEAMDVASITAANVRLLDVNNAVVAQAAGSPSLSADKRVATITPAASLKNSATYRIQVIGGASGVKDTLGKNMTSNFDQTPGFTCAAGTDTTPPTVSSATPTDGATNVPVTTKPTVTFSEAMDSATINANTVRLLDASGTPVAQAAGSPSLSANGLTATLTPATNLGDNVSFKVQVIGGASGAKDKAGNPLASTWTQPTGFKTENLPPSAVGNNRRTDVQ